MKILMLSATFPYPPTKGGTQVRTFNLLNTLPKDHHITLVTQRDGTVKSHHIEALRDRVDELKVFETQPTPPANLYGKLQRFGHSWLTGTPPNVSARANPKMQAWLDEQVDSGSFEVLTCEHSINEIFVRPQWRFKGRSQLRTIVNIHSSVYATCRQHLETGTSENVWRDRLNLPLLKRYERNYCQKFSQLVVTTPEDAQQFQALAPDAAINVIPNGVDLELFPQRNHDPGGATLIFAGAMDNQPNVDAACFLAQEIFPKLRSQDPELKLQLVGARPIPTIQALGEQPGITVTGKVASMAEALHQATVCVIPMRSGFGIKNKTLEALAAGIPVVGSDRALEGLALDQHIAQRAKTVPEYVDAIAQLLNQPNRRQQLSQAGRQFIETHYTWDVMGQKYAAVLRST